MKYKVGDHVIGNKKASFYYSVTTSGWRGVVVRVGESGLIDCRGAGLLGGSVTFKNLIPACFDLVEEFKKKIIITTDGKTVTAKLFNGKDLVKSAEAKCSPPDEFDFEKGAAIAVDRLLGRDAEDDKYLNCRVVCVSNSVPGRLPCSGFTVGKVYEVKAGIITDDNGWSARYKCESIRKLSENMGNQFIKFVE